MRKKILLTAAIVLAAVCVQAQNKSAGINLSLWRNISTQPDKRGQVSYFNLGIYTSLNELNGVGINLLGASAKTKANGLQLSGLINMTGSNMNGIQISGLANINGDYLRGVSISGLANIAGVESKGILITGLSNIVGENHSGIMVSSLINIAGQCSNGIHFAGLSNITGNDISGLSVAGAGNLSGDDLNGLHISGLGNVSGENMNGLHIAGLGNVAGGSARGVQLSALSNIVAKNFEGLQMSIFNMGRNVKGVQLGLVNYYERDMKGLQLGLVNANPSTRIQLMIFGGNSTKANVAARFKNELFYTILGAGSHFREFGDKISGAVFYRAGLELPLYKKLYISGDLGYQHIETFEKRSETVPKRLYALQSRLNLEYKFTGKFAMFATGGYELNRYYNKSRNYDKGVIFEGGIIIR